MSKCRLKKRDSFKDIQFDYFDENNEQIGMFEIRQELNDYQARYLGNIGYFVVIKYRNQGHATRMLKEGLQYCALLGMEQVFIVCNEQNIASRKVIINNGGKYIETVYEPCKAVYLERFVIEL